MKLTIAQQNEAHCAILIGQNAHSAEVHAANELAGYFQRITGAEFHIFATDKVPDTALTLILIGYGSPSEMKQAISRGEHNPIISDLIKAGEINPSAEKLGIDGFIIKGCTYKGHRCLVLGGSRPRSVLYAVYYLLEKYCNVGFFWDGEQIPSKETLTIPADINIARRPRFEHRSHGIGMYTPWFWGTLEQWRWYYDFAVKHYMNIVWCQAATGMFVQGSPGYGSSSTSVLTDEIRKALGLSDTGADSEALRLIRSISSEVIRNVFDAIDARGGAQPAGIGVISKQKFCAVNWFSVSWGGTAVSQKRDSLVFELSSMVTERDKPMEAAAMYPVPLLLFAPMRKFKEFVKHAVENNRLKYLEYAYILHPQETREVLMMIGKIPIPEENVKFIVNDLGALHQIACFLRTHLQYALRSYSLLSPVYVEQAAKPVLTSRWVIEW